MLHLIEVKLKNSYTENELGSPPLDMPAIANRLCRNCYGIFVKIVSLVFNIKLFLFVHLGLFFPFNILQDNPS